MSEGETPEVEIQTIGNPMTFSYAQIARAALLAAFLGRGKLVLCMPPEDD